MKVMLAQRAAPLLITTMLVVAPGEAVAGFVWLPVVCAQAGAATSIVVISRGAARCASITFIAGFSIVG